MPTNSTLYPTNNNPNDRNIRKSVCIFKKSIHDRFIINFLLGYSSSFRQSMCKLLYNGYNIMETKCKWRECLQCMWSLL
jgi:hypothetical protein